MGEELEAWLERLSLLLVQGLDSSRFSGSGSVVMVCLTFVTSESSTDFGARYPVETVDFLPFAKQT